MENSIFALGQGEHLFEYCGDPQGDAAFAQGRTWITHARELNLLTTYENRIRRSVEKNTAELRALQAERKAAVAKAEEEARLLVQLAEAEGGDYDPADDFSPESQPVGFVFSKPAIQRQIQRSERLGRALGLLNNPLDPNQQGPRHRANLRLIEKQAAATQN